MAATLLSASGRVTSVTQNVCAYEEIPLGGVDLSSRKVPLLSRVEFQFYLSDVPDTQTIFMGAITKNDDPSNLGIDQDGVIDSFLLDVQENASAPAYNKLSPIVIERRAPIYLASDSIQVAAFSGHASIDISVIVRVFFEVKLVSTNVMVALLSS